MSCPKRSTRPYLLRGGLCPVCVPRAFPVARKNTVPPIFAPLIHDLLHAPEDRTSSVPNLGAWNALNIALEGWTRRAKESGPERDRLIRLLVADQDLDVDEIRWCLGHLYSHLVSKYQGSIAEYLAAQELSIWLSEEIASERLREGGITGSNDPTPQPSIEPPPIVSVETLVDGAWTHYQRGRLDAAEESALAASA
jgi:hypothetical protein